MIWVMLDSMFAMFVILDLSLLMCVTLDGIFYCDGFG